MVTVTYDALNDLVHEVADEIVKTTGIPKETFNLFRLNDVVSEYLSDYGVQYEDETCPECGQPDNCGDCDHTPLSPDELESLKGG